MEEMEERIQVTLDFTKCKYLGEIYLEMRTKMEWADWYGENLDALWDILRGLPYKGDDFVIRRPYKFTGIPYGHDEAFNKHADKIIEIFQRATQVEGITVRIEYTDDDNTQNSDYLI